MVTSLKGAMLTRRLSRTLTLVVTLFAIDVFANVHTLCCPPYSRTKDVQWNDEQPRFFVGKASFARPSADLGQFCGPYISKDGCIDANSQDKSIFSLSHRVFFSRVAFDEMYAVANIVRVERCILWSTLLCALHLHMIYIGWEFWLLFVVGFFQSDCSASSKYGEYMFANTYPLS